MNFVQQEKGGCPPLHPILPSGKQPLVIILLARFGQSRDYTPGQVWLVTGVFPFKKGGRQREGRGPSLIRNQGETHMFILKNATANRNNAIILQNIFECIVHIFRQILVTVTNLQFVDQNDIHCFWLLLSDYHV